MLVLSRLRGMSIEVGSETLRFVQVQGDAVWLSWTGWPDARLVPLHEVTDLAGGVLLRITDLRWRNNLKTYEAKFAFDAPLSVKILRTEMTRIEFRYGGAR